MSKELITEALNFKGSGNYKKHNQLDNWKDVILAMKSNDFNIKAILEFILTKDSELSNIYKDRESTLYSLLCKYVRKLDQNEKSNIVVGKTNSILNIERNNEIEIVKKNDLFDIESEKLKHNISDEEEAELRKEFSSEYVDKFGLLSARAMIGMSS